jgi:hypothetical protein
MKKLLVFGALAGVALGLLSAGLDILIWSSVGCPAVLAIPRLGAGAPPVPPE